MMFVPVLDFPIALQTLKPRVLILWISLISALACKRPSTSDSSDRTDTGEMFLCAETPELPTLEDHWELSPVPSGGDFYQIAEAPSRPGWLYMASSMNGFYQSSDAGLNWNKIPMITTHMGGQIVIDPDNPDQVYISTGEIRKTVNGGEIWESLAEALPLDDETKVRGLLLEDGTLWAADSQGGIWRSDDQGSSFDNIGDLGFASPPPHIHGDATFGLNQGWIFLARGESRMYAVRHDNNLYTSDDDGVSWEILKYGAFTITSLGTYEDEVWVGGSGGVQYSIDGGESFEYYDSGDAEVQGIVRKAQGDLIVATEDQLHSLGDGVLLPLIQPAEATRLSHLLALQDGSLLVSDENGLLRSDDDGESWSDSSLGLNVTDLGPLLAHPVCPERVWAGTHCERGMFESKEWGGDLTHLEEYMHYVMVPRAGTVRPFDIWITTDDTLKYSSDLGETWSTMAETTLRWHLHGLAIHPTDPNVLLAGTCTGEYGDDTARVMRSEDRGQTFSESNTGIPEWEGSIHTLHYVQTNPQVVLAGTYTAGDMSHTGEGTGMGMFRSTDGGETWSLLELDVLDVPIIDECEGYLYAATDGGLMVSVDEGENWEVTLSSSETFMSVTCHEETVLAMAWGEIYRSDDYGYTWQAWQDGIDTDEWRVKSMPQVDISGDGALIFATVPGVGLYRRLR